MGNTITQMFKGVKPFDWLMLGIETAVLLLILYEVVVGIVRHRAAHRRQAHLESIVASLSSFIDKGQEIRQAVPEPSSDRVRDALAGEIEGWKQSAIAWETETENFLRDYSPRAATAFVLGEYGQKGPVVIHRDTGHSFVITDYLREAYQRLIVRLQDLRTIMEKPEAYF